MLLYNILFTLGFIFALPYFLIKIITQSKYRAGLWERLGFIPREKREKLFQKNPVWFHAVSVGEASAVFPLYKAFKEKYPDRTVIFSTTTKTGQEWISSKLSHEDMLLYFPLDFYWAVKHVLSIVQPYSFIAVETEIWPNFWWLAVQNGCRLGLINGRLSRRSFKRYVWVSFFVKHILGKLSFLSCQTEEDALRFLELGAPKECVTVGGNLKFEISTDDPKLIQQSRELKKRLGINDEIILMGGSTHEGEELILIRCVEELKMTFPKLRLILAPRHPERFKDVEKLVLQSGFECMLDSKLEIEMWKSLSSAILLIDQMGKLPLYYSLADMVFMGKSLTSHGGQNLLEPAVWGKIILFGPYMENFRHIADQFIEEKAAVEIHHEKELKDKIRQLLLSDIQRQHLSENAKKLVEKNKGALNLNLKYIEKHLLCRP